MSERKVLTKYYPPDFDPSKIERRRGPKQTGPKQQTVRLMAPFSMKCTSCGEYIYKGRKFNARKETTEEKYYAITIFRFYIRCTRCSAEITFKTDPKNMDYECERGARRNFEVWREAKLNEETEEERLDRLEREENEKDAMKELEQKTMDAKTEMAVADALDEVRTRNAQRERGGVEGALEGLAGVERRRDEEVERAEREIEEQARLAFQSGTGERVKRVVEEDGEEGGVGGVESQADKDKKAMPPPPAPTFQRQPRKKKDFGAALGIKKKPALVPSCPGLTPFKPPTPLLPRLPRSNLSVYLPPLQNKLPTDLPMKFLALGSLIRIEEFLESPLLGERLDLVRVAFFEADEVVHELVVEMAGLQIEGAIANVQGIDFTTLGSFGEGDDGWGGGVGALLVDFQLVVWYIALRWIHGVVKSKFDYWV
ncbi:Pre-mRNA-splicing factor cwf16 [Saxophila tyrrhenica]|uniref:Splicing factor YJU2 n=1 Tax=Saxophila tyrrhenica TaxID=1690608 RepID=A0AAV9P2H4_9PEZI|nr:Pre-mRNA-splicing factor cwf16 [Saxophila tyrrhenica]